MVEAGTTAPAERAAASTEVLLAGATLVATRRAINRPHHYFLPSQPRGTYTSAVPTVGRIPEPRTAGSLRRARSRSCNVHAHPVHRPMADTTVSPAAMPPFHAGYWDAWGS